jgi:hypothetical protein
MRLTAPAIGGAAIALAAALVWFFQPPPERQPAPELQAIAPGEQPAERSPQVSSEPPRIAVPASDASSENLAANAAPAPERSPLPGEASATPMAQAIADQQNRGGDSAFPPEFAEGEREFAAEPIDSTWAPGAEASLLSTFAQVPGLELVDLQVHCRSTMCRVQTTQSIDFSPDSPRVPPFKLGEHVDMKPRWMMTVTDGAPPTRPPQIGDPPLLLKSIAYFWRDGFAPERAPRAADAPN